MKKPIASVLAPTNSVTVKVSKSAPACWCVDCKFFMAAGKNSTHGRCRRYPPVTGFPLVKLHDTCGEFKPNA